MTDIQKTGAMTTDAARPRPYGRVFSGIQPTGNLTLGNYLGAIRSWVTLQRDYECIYCIVDWHALTVWQEPAELTRTTRQSAAALMACGIDPAAHILFNQSQNPDHVELAWIFNCVTRLGWLNRMTQFKEKAGKDRERASSGLFVYPNLMAADILAYKSTHVPVGEDQKQHLELARDIAEKFNTDWNRPGFLPTVEPLIPAAAARVMSLRDGTKKMSKSDPSDMSRINLDDDAEVIARKIRKAKTDAQPLPDTAAGCAERPEARNLATIYAALTDQSPDQAFAEIGGMGFAQFKPLLIDAAVARLAPVGQEMKRLLGDPAEIDRILADGGARARALSAPVLAEIRAILGLVRQS